MLQSSSPDLISLSTLMSLLLPASSFSRLSQYHASAHYNSCIFSSFFFSMRVSNGHAGSISMNFLFFLSIAVISGRLCSRVLSVYKGKCHKILQISDSKTFSSLCIYHFFALLKPHNLHLCSHNFQCNILATLS